MKRKHYVISIPNPCHEDWEKMSPMEKGRFCNTCSKTILDFSLFSEEQLIHYLQQYKGGELCGRYSAGQLDRPLVPAVVPRFGQASKWLAGISLFVSGLLNFKLSAQVNPVPVETPLSDSFKTGKMVNTRGFGITGRVIDEKAKWVKDAKVFCPNTGISVLTDSSGLFQFPTSNFNGEEIVEFQFTKFNFSMAVYQSKYKDLPGMLEISLTAIPISPLMGESIELTSRMDTVHMDKIIIESGQKGIETRVTSGICVVSYGTEVEKRKRPVIDMMSNTRIID